MRVKILFQHFTIIRPPEVFTGSHRQAPVTSIDNSVFNGRVWLTFLLHSWAKQSTAFKARWLSCCTSIYALQYSCKQ